MDPKAKYTLLFDRESRGNPGPSELGGVTKTPERRICKKIVWNIRQKT